MHITRKRLVTALGLAAATIALLAGGASGCPTEKGPGTGGTADGGGTILKACDTTIVKQPQRLGVGHTIEAETKSMCSPPPRSHVVFITIQYHPDIKGADYITMGTKFCNAKPIPGTDTDCHVTLNGACHVGIWRMRVQITGTGPNGTPFSLVLPNKRTVKIKSCGV